jgi:thiol-disulfide isomerase/thioredoxin
MDALIRLAAVVVILAASAIAYVWWSKRQGRVHHVHLPGALTPDDLGAPRGLRATFVQFSTPICAKCPPTRALLLRVAQDYPHVHHIEIDASERLDLARRLDIMRTPTILVLDADGVVVSRMNGAPSEAQVREALDEFPPPGEYSI